MADATKKTLGEILEDCLSDDYAEAQISRGGATTFIHGVFDLKAVTRAFLETTSGLLSNEVLAAAAVAYERESSAWSKSGDLERGDWAVIRKMQIVEEGLQTQDEAQVRMTLLRRAAAMKAALFWLQGAGSLDKSEKARPLAEWNESIGDVLWWTFPIEEPPYFGSPLSAGRTVEMRHYDGKGKVKTVRTSVGGWPGYHTHFTQIIFPEAPE